MKVKLCIACKHHYQTHKHICRNPKAIMTSTYYLSSEALPDAYNIRDSFFKCGKRGRWFEAKENANEPNDM